MVVDKRTVYWVSFANFEKERRKLEAASGSTGTASAQGEKKSRKKTEQPAPTTA